MIELLGIVLFLLLVTIIFFNAGRAIGRSVSNKIGFSESFYLENKLGFDILGMLIFLLGYGTICLILKFLKMAY